MSNKQQAILDAAIFFARDGGAFRISDVAEKAGVAPALIYRYFDGREGLEAAAYSKISTEFVAQNRPELARLHSLDAAEAEALLYPILAASYEPDYAPRRWARLEALARYRPNPALAVLLDVSRKEAVDLFLDAIHPAPDSVTQAERDDLFPTFLYILSIPLGFTGMGGYELLTSGQRECFSRIATRHMVLALRDVGIGKNAN